MVLFLCLWSEREREREVTYHQEGRGFWIAIHSGHHVFPERGKEASFSSQQRKSKDQITRCCSRKLGAARSGRSRDHPDNTHTHAHAARGVSSIHRIQNSSGYIYMDVEVLRCRQRSRGPGRIFTGGGYLTFRHYQETLRSRSARVCKLRSKNKKIFKRHAHACSIIL